MTPGWKGRTKSLARSCAPVGKREAKTGEPQAGFPAGFAHLTNIVRSFVAGYANHDIKPVMRPETMKANLGSLHARVAGPARADSAMPTSVMMYPRAVDPDAGPAFHSFGKFESPGVLGPAFASFAPGAGAHPRQDMQLNLPLSRLSDRRALLESLDQMKSHLEQSLAYQSAQTTQQKAFDALLNNVARVFDLSKENLRLIDRDDTRRRFRPERIDKKWNSHKP
jgi:hypothetical protein